MIVLSAVVLLALPMAEAQLTAGEEKGLPSNSTFGGGDVDVVNLQNGNHWETPTLGADYFIENSTLYYHTGGTTSFSWSPLATITPTVSGTASTGFTYTWTIPASDFTNGVPLATTERYLVEGTGYSPEVYAPIFTATQP